MQLARPTVFPSVPRLLNRLYNRVLSRMIVPEDHKDSWSDVLTTFPPPSLGRYFFHRGMAAKKELLKQNIYEDGLWDMLVFNKIAARLGGRVRAVTSGSAPLSPDVSAFLRIAFSCPLSEGYGLTETCAAACFNSPGDCSIGNVGGPHPSTEIKLASVPEMLYMTENGHGEVCVRGPSVTRGYCEQVILDFAFASIAYNVVRPLFPCFIERVAFHLRSVPYSATFLQLRESSSDTATTKTQHQVFWTLTAGCTLAISGSGWIRAPCALSIGRRICSN